MSSEITLDTIIEAAQRIKVHKTPVLTNKTISQLASLEEQPIDLFFKCELFQKTGSFKFRGASNAIALLSHETAASGVVTHSSGNHAQALALAAKTKGTPAYIVMPRTAPTIKKAAVIGYGAQVIECEPTQIAREEAAQKVVLEKGATLIHPFNDPNVIAGQGTIAVELLSQVKDLDALIIPVGGGGMLTGCSIAAKSLCPSLRIFAAEPEAVNDCYRSFKNKHQETNEKAISVADGLLTNLGDIAYSNIHQYVDDVFTVSEKQIINTMELVWERMKLCIEPSAAVGVAVAIHNKEFKDTLKRLHIQRIGVILCGGNVDVLQATALFEQYRYEEGKSA
ncbi:tryptophan synthase beta subunit-like PLP-dependent enzyme [Mycotypha africana]|uniref:tryptophan synthase beta subunit-like PLP-dependent enzyme n=1 Tax=Mycotypha africana TaxID=64632 RepID=UPI002300A591|nr:tryptophan synthase beta subunit-like PLP-dependent enzyme [Mycotypha africana]KAI8967688.1 tryptophan synthase beta subunit-like PLP-dependent enzyme [Mycotypha africana]